MTFQSGDSKMNLRLEQLAEAASAYVDKVMEEQKAGVALVAYTSKFVPAELIRASGANTYMLCRGGDLAPAQKALEYTMSSINPQARALFGYLAEDMDPVAAAANLVVTAYYDSHMSRISELLEFKGGSFKAATKAQCPIVPVALIDSYKAFDTGSVQKIDIKVSIQKPLSPEDYKGKKTVEIADEVKNIIENTIKKCNCS